MRVKTLSTVMSIFSSLVVQVINWKAPERVEVEEWRSLKCKKEVNWKV